MKKITTNYRTLASNMGKTRGSVLPSSMTAGSTRQSSSAPEGQTEQDMLPRPSAGTTGGATSTVTMTRFAKSLTDTTSATPEEIKQAAKILKWAITLLLKAGLLKKKIRTNDFGVTDTILILPGDEWTDLELI